ncbi:MAG: transglutaminase-like domain-containing protein, partial [Erysipelotrichaceae bacterium]|nr:transglutaminase-like domain-containing protein [Erysipelotrichaceae bacterium]
DPDNDEDLPEVRRLARAKLDEVGWDLYRAYQWSVNIPYIPEDTAYSVTGGALYAFHNNQGDCIAKAASFCVMARELGYPCNVIWGQVPLARGGMSPHAWTEIVYNGSTYVYEKDSVWTD